MNSNLPSSSPDGTKIKALWVVVGVLCVAVLVMGATLIRLVRQTDQPPKPDLPSVSQPGVASVAASQAVSAAVGTPGTLSPSIAMPEGKPLTLDEETKKTMNSRAEVPLNKAQNAINSIVDTGRNASTEAPAAFSDKPQKVRAKMPEPAVARPPGRSTEH